MCLQITVDCKKKTSTSPNRRERPLVRKTGWVTTERETTDGQKEGDIGGMQRGSEDAVLYEKGG